VVTQYLLDGSQEIAEYDGTGTLLRRYVFGPGIDEPVATIAAAGTKSYNHQDALGSVIALSDGTTGAVGDKYTYSAYGESPSLAGNAFRYTGRRVDAETGLYYYRARYYSPRLGRFLQPDPIGYQGGLNLYAYVGGDPLNLTDPSGLIADAIYNTAASGADYVLTHPGQTAVGVGLIGAGIAGCVFTACTADVPLLALAGGGTIAVTVPTVAGVASTTAVVTGGAILMNQSTLQPGPYAGDSIPARGPERDFTPEERAAVNEIGQTTGCHTCGTTNPGTASGNFIPDHQPPSKLVEPGTPQQLYPQCLNCSRIQGGQVRAATGGQ